MSAHLLCSSAILIIIIVQVLSFWDHNDHLAPSHLLFAFALLLRLVLSFPLHLSFCTIIRLPTKFPLFIFFKECLQGRDAKFLLSSNLSKGYTPKVHGAHRHPTGTLDWCRRELFSRQRSENRIQSQAQPRILSPSFLLFPTATPAHSKQVLPMLAIG